MNELEIARTLIERFKNNDPDLRSNEIDRLLSYINDHSPSGKEIYKLAFKYKIISERNALMEEYKQPELQYYILRVFSLCSLENPLNEEPPLSFKEVQSVEAKLNLHKGRFCFWEPSGAENIQKLKNKLMRLILMYSAASRQNYYLSIILDFRSRHPTTYSL